MTQQLVQGIGNEFVWLGLFILCVVLLFLAWSSTHVNHQHGRPADSLWMVQVQTSPFHRVLEVVQMADPSGSVDAQEIIGGDGSASTSSENTDEVEERPPAPSESTQLADQLTEDSSEANIRLKFLDDTSRLVGTWLKQTVGDFKRANFKDEVDQGKVVRLIYKGQMLRDDSRSLESYGLHENCIVHCHFSAAGPNRSRPPGLSLGDAANSEEEQNTGIGEYVQILFGTLICSSWIFYIFYSRYFDLASYFSLLVCSLVYSLFAYHEIADRIRRMVGWFYRRRSPSNRNR